MIKIYGKHLAMQRIESFRSSGRMPHALLLYGAKGIGKRTLADYVAMTYVCEDKQHAPCMKCRSCRLAAQHGFPDIAYPLPMIEEEHKRDTKKGMVEMLRAFIASCSAKPIDSDVRVVVFGQIDRLSVQMQNTLLKFIEEPLDFNKYIFTADNKAPVIQTVLSRVTAVNVDPADCEEFAEALSEHKFEDEHTVPPARITELFDMFGGNIGAAIEYEAGGESVQYLAAALKACDAVAARRELDCLLALLSLKTRDELFGTIGVIADIMAQAAVFKSGAALPGAFRKQTVRLAESFSLEKITAMYEEMNRLYGKSYTNPNQKLFAAECTSSLMRAAAR